MQIAIIADDLTGACDAAVHFAARGVETRVSLDGNQPTSPVAAFTTDSRDTDAATTRQRLISLARHARPKLLFKKIDSVLRGHPGREIALTLDVFGYDQAIVTPAYPEMGRTVKNGLLQLPDPIDIGGKLFAEGLDPERCQVLDATTNRHLDEIVRNFATERVLWCGSGGLALALARRLTPARPVTPPEPTTGTVCFCIGSDHPATVAQEAALPPEATVLHIDRNGTTPDEIRALLRRPRPAALFVTGGDTATMVFSALGANSITLHGEVVRGVPWGTLHGGIMDGVAVVTKSGGFGAPDTLVRVLEFFAPKQ